MNRNCNVRGGCVNLPLRTAPIFGWGCSQRAEGYIETNYTLNIAPSSLLINCF